MRPVPAVRLPGCEFQRSEAQVVRHESHRTQEVLAGAYSTPFEVPEVLRALVANASLYDGNSPLCSILCSHSARHASVQHDPVGRGISGSGLGPGKKHP